MARPIVIVLMVVTILGLLWPVISGFIERRTAGKHKLVTAWE
jgi:hypothetical protein